jgi:hypothetical protein
MRFVMTTCAKAYKVISRIVKFVSILVMNMKKNAPSFTRFSAVLTSPVISIFNIFTNSFPVIRILPLGNATLPCRIFITANSTGEGKGFGLSSCWNIKYFDIAKNSCYTYIKLISNIFSRTLVNHILLINPILIFIKHNPVPMPVDMDAPTIGSLIPPYWISAPAFTKWGNRTNWRNVLNWLASLPVRMRCFGISYWNSVSNQNITNALRGNRIFAPYCFRPNKCTVWSKCLIYITNASFNLWRKFSCNSHTANYSTLMQDGVA